MTDFAREHARSTDLDTSHIAAERAEGMAARQKRIIHATLVANGPMTSDEVARVVGLLPHQVIKRMSDLRNESIVIDSGERRQTRTGRPAAVWKLNPVQLDLPLGGEVTS